MEIIKFKYLRAIFFIQVGLLLVMAILFIIGFSTNGMHFGIFFFAIILGTLGASVSLMKRIRDQKSRFVDSTKEFKLYSTLFPILYGSLMSGVAYLLFMSGILTGDAGGGLITTNLFPNFTQPGLNDGNLFEQFVSMTPSSTQDAGKLFVWCFLGGYSERFVTGVLDQLEFQSTS